MGDRAIDVIQALPISDDARKARNWERSHWCKRIVREKENTRDN
jgi:hypothetical protein